MFNFFIPIFNLYKIQKGPHQILKSSFIDGPFLWSNMTLYTNKPSNQTSFQIANLASRKL